MLDQPLETDDLIGLKMHSFYFCSIQSLKFNLTTGAWTRLVFLNNGYAYASCITLPRTNDLVSLKNQLLKAHVQCQFKT